MTVQQKLVLVMCQMAIKKHINSTVKNVITLVKLAMVEQIQIVFLVQLQLCIIAQIFQVLQEVHVLVLQILLIIQRFKLWNVNQIIHAQLVSSMITRIHFVSLATLLVVPANILLLIVHLVILLLLRIQELIVLPLQIHVPVLLHLHTSNIIQLEPNANLVIILAWRVVLYQQIV